MRRVMLVETASAEKLAALLEDNVKAGVADINPLETSIIDGLIAAVKKHKLGNVTGVKLNAIGISNALDKIAKALKAAIKDYDENAKAPKQESGKETDEDQEVDEDQEIDEGDEEGEVDEGEEDDSEESTALAGVQKYRQTQLQRK